jgi:biotin carboxyl carrier protein/Na+-transporting methylmalonyl-CoA/oxaloacetate decarboxylase gamma subunit
MSILESLFISVFGIAVVFIVLVGLSLMIMLQSALITRLSKTRLAKADEPKSDAAVNALNDSESGAHQSQPSPQATAPVEGHMPTDCATVNSSGGHGVKKKYAAMLNGKVYEAEVEEVIAPQRENKGMPKPVTSPDAAPVQACKPPSRVPIPAPSPPKPASAPAAAGTGIITAPVPGTVADIKTAVGAKVKRGDILLLLEAMKMENEIVAISDGTVAQIMTAKGASVEMGTPLVMIQ